MRPATVLKKKGQKSEGSPADLGSLDPGHCEFNGILINSQKELA